MRTHHLAMRLSALCSVLLYSGWGTFCQATERTSSYLAAAQSIDAQQLQRHVDFLADDTLEGREPGTSGGRQAGDYLLAQLQQLHLRGAGVDGGFVQQFDTNFRNILGMIEGSDPALKNEIILLFAHYDHVGYGTEENSAGPTGQIHNGADDNASGTSALLELAEAITCLPRAPRRSILFAFWDAEEMGMLGSRHWAAHPTVPLQRVVTAINLDMVGRLRDHRLTVYGTRSGFGFRRLLSQQNDTVGLEIDFSWELEDDSDHFTFFKRGIPVLFLHTGLHDQFHSPSDDADLINSEGMEKTARFLFHVLWDLCDRAEVPRFREAAAWETEELREQLAGRLPRLRDRLGAGFTGRSSRARSVQVATVAARSPAAEAGLLPGDRIIRLADHEVSTASELTSAVLLADRQIPLVVERPGRLNPISLIVHLSGEPTRVGIVWRVDDAEPHCVVLAYVIPGSHAADAGLRVGDCIYQVDGQDFANQAELIDLLKAPSDTLNLLVEGGGQQRYVQLQFRSR